MHHNMAETRQLSSSFTAVEEDIRSLMGQVSAARFALRQSESQQLATTRKLFIDLIEVLDAFERVFRNIKAKEDQVTAQMKTWIGNFRTVRRLLEKPLSEHGVVRIEHLEQGFDPNWHKASEVVLDPSRPEGTIIEELKAGYLWRGQVLRKAEVVVVGAGQGKETSQESAEDK